jgi:hypothetical protein
MSVLRQECFRLDKLKAIGDNLGADMNTVVDKQVLYGWRDPWNHFASLISFWSKRRKATLEECAQLISELYIPEHKRVLRNALDIEQHLPKNAIFWQYDKWFCDSEYRKHLSQKLGLASPDAGVNIVWNISSFDNTKRGDDARNLDICGRWRHYIDASEFRALFKDQELTDLASQFFIPPF